ncbi:NAD(+) diphosphatase [Gilvimarinus sp. SDUM040013]|uniref:NAD(+) diphosphatase n=1 Tax=Gilvimarinus gilvus TaxID=3058038 RepID=A0ABU4S270_9GAMM|nr:NAD(+) diphosphatase [Gilvimarinus sp. SDUM040013]MDO3385686.1 NAD(+) diphosphatase [Gilvimarinus sp. SDUM040013]MDX6849324.1 NAD(+) diphosphatase [Gilvimarinus sp. SDUM040013]
MASLSYTWHVCGERVAVEHSSSKAATTQDLHAHCASAICLPLPGNNNDRLCIHRDVDLPDGYEWLNLRQCMSSFSESEFTRAGVALQVAHWWESHQFCSRCATALSGPTDDQVLALEFQRFCGVCNVPYYPRINPCIIVLVTRGELCLLAKHTRSKTATYTTLAGFVEPGESIESAVHREVAEEVGIEVTNLAYQCSQSWPFPGQLMLGFYADYSSGELALQQDEIQDAGWYRAEHLPKVPPKGTIARKLIDGFIDKQVSKQTAIEDKERRHRAL